MKKSILLLSALFIVFSSCKKEDDVIVIGDHVRSSDTYLLTEILADPGDGSGTFQPVESNKYIKFHSDSTVTSNGELCRMSIETNMPTTGTYSMADSTISSADCNDFHFELNGNELIVYYQCIEACQAKFLKQE